MGVPATREWVSSMISKSMRAGGGGGGGAKELKELTDVVITSPVNDEILKYDEQTGMWKNSKNQNGTTVVANPSGEATADLKKLQVGNDIFKIPEGGGGGGGGGTTTLTNKLSLLWNPNYGLQVSDETTSKTLPNVGDSFELTNYIVKRNTASDVLVTVKQDGEYVKNTSEKLGKYTSGGSFTVVLTQMVAAVINKVEYDDIKATNITYDNTTSELESTNLQDAVDELANLIKNIKPSGQQLYTLDYPNGYMAIYQPKEES